MPGVVFQASVLGFLSTGQLLEYVVTSDALYNVTTMRTVLRSLEGEDSAIPLSKMDAFLMEFNVAIAQVIRISAEDASLFSHPFLL